MMKNAITALTTLTALGLLASACTASTGAEPSGSTSSADTSGCGWNSANTDVTYDNMSSCYDLVGDNTVYASNYGTDACNAFTAEFDGTDANTSNLFNVTVSPSASLTSSNCASTTLQYTVFGLEVTVNLASHTDTVDWIPITTATVMGSWTGSYCQFDPSSGGVTRSFSARIDGAGPNTIPVYEDLKVVGTVSQPARIIRAEADAPHQEFPIFPLTWYLPFSVHLEKQYCG
jgi:hypothetical protein